MRSLERKTETLKTRTLTTWQECGRPGNFLCRKINTNKWSPEKRRIRKIARLLESWTRTEQPIDIPTFEPHILVPEITVTIPEWWQTSTTLSSQRHSTTGGWSWPSNHREYVNTFQLKQDLEDFDCRLHLQEFSYKPEDEQDTPQRRWLKEKSTWPSIKTERVSLKHTSEQWRKTSVIWQTTPDPRRDNLNRTKMSLRLYCCFYKL